MSPHRVMVVDDEKGIRDALKQVLEYEDLEVRVAASGALERSRTVALEYAERAREHLNGGFHRFELEAMTYAVVERRT